MTITEIKPRGVHFVGSILLPTADECFRHVMQKVPGRVRRIPDGETGIRSNWIGFQTDLFAKYPGMLRSLNLDYTSNEVEEYSVPDGLTDMLEQLDTGYDRYAIESYSVFRRLRKEGVIPEGVRFQVCLPTPAAVVSALLNQPFTAIAEPYYEAALLRALRNLQDEIPAQDLAIQFDIAFEVGLFERVDIPMYVPWFTPAEHGVYERIQRLAGAVDAGVELGFHLCYGDLNHAHLVQPKDTQLLVDMANTISARCAHKIAFMHMPVPKDREDSEYFEPLLGLALDPETELYLGLVHGWDEAGTRRRIAAASKVLRDFGVATECGFGRFGQGELETVFEISAAVTEPVG